MIKPKVSIIIRCLNEEKYIGRLLAGISEQDYKDLEIIVVDSGSTDATLSIVSNYSCKVINIKPEDFSFGYALNVGCKAASGDILLFASAHVYPLYKDWISLMVEPFLNEEKTVLVYGRQEGDERTRFSEHMIFSKWFPEYSNKNQDHPFCNNANCAILKSAWLKRPYDETLTGLEDLAWAKLAQESGDKIAYQAGASIAHIHEEKWSSVYNRYRREAIALRLIMKHETFNFLTFIKLLTINIINDLKAAFKQKVLIKNLVSIIRFRYNQFWGTYRGYKQSYLLDNKVRERFYYPSDYKFQQEKKSTSADRKIDYSSKN
jgi:rhamnosyltransferase